MYKPYRNLTLIILIAAVLAACSNPATVTPVTSPAPATTSAATSAVTETPAVTDTPMVTGTTEATATAEMTATVEMTATTQAATGSDCLVGTWKFANISDYFGSILSQGQSPATYTGSEGDILYTFGADGKASINAQDFVAKFNFSAQNLTVPLEVHLTGTADVGYTATTTNQITFSDVQANGLKFSATMGGQELFSSTPAELSAAFGVSNDPQYNTFKYECSATTLMYTPPISTAKPITLERVP